jgi:hypothetical protein
LKCGAIPGVHPTVDFGIFANISYAFDIQRQFTPKGPLVKNSKLIILFENNL